MLAAAAGVSSRTVERIERGERRPSETMLVRLSRALRPGCDAVTVAALTARLCDLADASLVRYSRRPNRKRAALLAQVRAVANGGPPCSDVDDLEAVVLANLARMTARPPDPPEGTAPGP